MIQTRTILTAAVLAASLAACSSPQSAPEPENETTAAEMPDAGVEPAAGGAATADANSGTHAGATDAPPATDTH
ncbi:hypothetical protein GGQ87_000210 [Brevundimonas alba]|uniref:Lipoprotein n=1 Tax=Brevundimonas alba TaxID=74314 RepID=A0A7X6BM42_9CAUL|nr:hypothetical protein [Brevundimonas alba]NJC39952.1 hypothetical protein [Brevundimonas alba]